MKEWRSLLTEDISDWLMTSKDPSLRYRVLTELLDQPADGPEALEARGEIMSSGPVAKILSKQQAGGHWGREEDFYMRSKYRGTVWNIILLAELAPEPGDERIVRAGDFVLRWSRRPDGGFTYVGDADGGRHAALACLSGNMVSSLVRLGFGDDQRLIPSYEFLGRLAREEILLGKGRCERCRTGLVKLLKGLDAVPEKHREVEAASTRDALADDVVDLCLPGGRGREPRSDWSHFGFPLMWNTDLIEVLDLVGLPMSDERVSRAVEIVMDKRDAAGRWGAESNFTGRTLVSFGSRGSPSRWVTFRALSMLKHLSE